MYRHAVDAGTQGRGILRVAEVALVGKHERALVKTVGKCHDGDVAQVLGER